MVGVFDKSLSGAQQLAIYLNGSLVGTATGGSADIATSATNVTIGEWSSLTGRAWSGQLDDVRIYNYALTPYQIKTLYNENSAVRFGPLTGSP